MGDKLPVVSGKQMVKFLESSGFKIDRKKGSHITLGKGDIEVTVPVHKNKDLKKGTSTAILHEAAISQEEFKRAIRGKK